jgi:hypothetical protein
MSTGRAWTHRHLKQGPGGLFCPVHWWALRPVNGSRFPGRFRVFLCPFLIYHPLPPLGPESPWSNPFNVPVVDSLGGPQSARPKADACLSLWSRSFRQPLHHFDRVHHNLCAPHVEQEDLEHFYQKKKKKRRP